jgi:hypothetical protein
VIANAAVAAPAGKALMVSAFAGKDVVVNADRDVVRAMRAAALDARNAAVTSAVPAAASADDAMKVPRANKRRNYPRVSRSNWFRRLPESILLPDRSARQDGPIRSLISDT